MKFSSICFSFIFISNPLLIAEPFLVAHRGASGNAPENTLPAFRLAWQEGADAIEGDFHLTADGSIVCIHDYDTRKTCGEKHVVAETKLSDLQSLDAGAWFHKKFSRTPIPTLGEVVETVPAGKKIFLEIKSGPEIVPSLIDTLEKSDLQPSQIVVISFKAEVIAALEKLRPAWTSYWLTSVKGKTLADLKPSSNEILTTLRNLGCDGVSTSGNPLITKEWIDLIRGSGFEYHIWTVNDADLARQFLRKGAQSITTDFPAKLRKQLFAKDRD